MDFRPDPQQSRVLGFPSGRSVLVTGEAGTGKSTVAVERAARMARKGGRTLVLAPTTALASVLERRLHRVRMHVRVADVGTWLAAAAAEVVGVLEPGEETPADVLRAKRHPAVADVLDELLESDDQPLSRQRLFDLWGDRYWLDSLRIASDGAVSDADVAAIERYARIQFSEEHLDADGRPIIGMGGIAVHRGTPLHDAGTVDRADLSVLLAFGRARGRHPRGYAHVVVDEAQELSFLELAAVGAVGDTLTLVGDAGQQLDEAVWFGGWASTIRATGHDVRPVRLTVSHRCPPDVLAVARAVRSGAPVPRRGRWTVWRSEVERAAALREPGGVLVAYDQRRARRLARLVGRPVRPVDALRGIEVDRVVVPDVSPAGWPDTAAGRRALYVALTRARVEAWIGTIGRWSTVVRVG